MRFAIEEAFVDQQGPLFNSCVDHRLKIVDKAPLCSLVEVGCEQPVGQPKLGTTPNSGDTESCSRPGVMRQPGVFAAVSDAAM